MKKFLSEFKAFALKGNVLDLAVAVIIGGAFQTIINSVVNDLIMPVVNWIFGGIDFSNKYIVLRSGDAIVTEAVTSGTDIITPAVTVSDIQGSLADLEAAGIGVFEYGSFITAVINFILMALVIFLLVKGVNKLTSLAKKPEPVAEPTTKTCPYCLSEVPIKATRCAHCTSVLDENPDKE